jgi:hypothetical protein
MTLKGWAKWLFDKYSRDWAGDPDNRDWEELTAKDQKEWIDDARELMRLK